MKELNETNMNPNSSAAYSGSAQDDKKKLSELRSMILGKGDAERERILSEARAEADRWTEEQTGQLEAMIVSIKADAVKRAAEITARQLAEAESARDKSRLRLQNDLVNKAFDMLQKALVGFAARPDYDAILTGAAAEVCGRLPKGQKVKIRLRAEDALHGEPVAKALSARFPELEVTFDAEPAAIIGGVFLYSEEEKWRVAADWKSKVEEMADGVGRAVLAEL